MVKRQSEIAAAARSRGGGSVVRAICRGGLILGAASRSGASVGRHRAMGSSLVSAYRPRSRDRRRHVALPWDRAGSCAGRTPALRVDPLGLEDS